MELLEVVYEYVEAEGDVAELVVERAGLGAKVIEVVEDSARSWLPLATTLSSHGR